MLFGNHHRNIAMQHSKSLRSFSSDSAAPILRQRPSSRSSLDTFVIPGRTRIPSNKPQPIDIQIAEALLDSTMALPKRESSNDMAFAHHRKDSEEKRLLEILGIQDTKRREATEEQPLLDQELQQRSASSPNNEPDSMFTLHSQTRDLSNVRPEISKRPPPQMGGRDLIIVPPRRTRKIGANPPRKRVGPTPSRKITPLREKRNGIYDGALGSGYESRTTSMTWSTVSHRIFTETSASFHGLGALKGLGEFNRLAVQHGLPKLEKCPGGESVLRRT